MGQHRKQDEDSSPSHAGLDELIAKAQQGDTAVLPQLQELLDSTPELWREAADLAKHAEEAWISLIAGNDLLLAASLRKKLAEMKSELVEPDASALEKLLVDRIVICWLQMEYADLSYAQSADASLQQGRFLLQRQQTCQNRYLAAVRALTTLRKLMPKSATVSTTSGDKPPSRDEQKSSDGRDATRTSNPGKENDGKQK